MSVFLDAERSKCRPFPYARCEPSRWLRGAAAAGFRWSWGRRGGYRCLCAESHDSLWWPGSPAGEHSRLAGSARLCGTSPAASPVLGVALKPEREEPEVVFTACPRFATEALCDVGSGGLENEGKVLPVQERFLLSPV